MVKNFLIFLLLSQRLFSQNPISDTLTECKSYRFRLEHDNPNYLRVTIFKNGCYNMDLIAYHAPINQVMTLSFGSYEINKSDIIFTDKDKNYEIKGVIEKGKLMLTNGFGPFVGKEIKIFNIEKWQCFNPYRTIKNFENDTITNFKFKEGKYIGPAQQARFNFSNGRFTISFENFVFASGKYNLSDNEIILQEEFIHKDFKLKISNGKIYDVDMPWLLMDTLEEDVEVYPIPFSNKK